MRSSIELATEQETLNFGTRRGEFVIPEKVQVSEDQKISGLYLFGYNVAKAAVIGTYESKGLLEDMCRAVTDECYEMTIPRLLVYKIRFEDLEKKHHIDFDVKNTMRNILEYSEIPLKHQNGYSESHSKRVTVLCKLIGKEMMITESAANKLLWAAYLHDFGKMGLGDLIKSAQSIDWASNESQDERELIEMHPLFGQQITEGMDHCIHSYFPVSERWIIDDNDKSLDGVHDYMKTMWIVHRGQGEHHLWYDHYKLTVPEMQRVRSYGRFFTRDEEDLKFYRSTHEDTCEERALRILPLADGLEASWAPERQYRPRPSSTVDVLRGMIHDSVGEKKRYHPWITQAFVDSIDRLNEKYGDVMEYVRIEARKPITEIIK